MKRLLISLICLGLVLSNFNIGLLAQAADNHNSETTQEELNIEDITIESEEMVEEEMNLLDDSSSIYNTRSNLKMLTNDEEPNNSYYEAQLITGNDSVIGTLSYEDEFDIFKVTLNEPGLFSINVKFMFTGGLKVTDPDGNAFVDAYWYWGSPTSPKTGYPSRYLEAGTYYILVEKNYNSSGGYYELNTSFEVTKNNEIEPNNTYQTAQTLKINKKVKGLISSNDSTDIYKIVLKEPGLLKLEIKTMFDAKVYLANSGGTDFYESGRTYGSLSDLSTLNYSDYLEAGTYYLQVYGYDGNTGVYELKTSFKSTGNNEKEPNNSYEDAQQLSVNDKVKGLISQSDYKDIYKIKVTESGTLNIKNKYTFRGEFHIANEDGDGLYNNSSINGYPDDVNTFKHSIFLEKGIYYLVVERQGYSPYTGVYDLTLDFTPSLSIKSVNIETKTIKGTSLSDAIVKAYVNGRQIGAGSVSSNGTYTISIPKQKAGTKITVKMTKSGVQTVSKATTVLNVFKTLTTNTVNTSTTKVTGKGTKGATVKAYVNGKQIGKSATVNSKGSYTITIPKQKAGTKIVVKMSKSGYVTKSTTATVLNVFKTLTTNTVNTSTTKVTGKGTKGATVKAYVNGKQIGKTATVNSKGNYTITIPKQKAGTEIVVEMSKSGYVTKSTTATVLNVFKTLTTNTVNTSTTKVTGKGTKGATVKAYVNGKQIGKTATVNSKGNYTITIPKQKAGTEVVVEMSKSGYVTKSTTATVLNVFKTLTTNTVNTSTTKVTGKGTKGATVKAYVNGKQIGKTATVNSKGNYTITIPKQKAGTEVVVEMSKSGYATKSVAVKVTK